jgi:hypothetical protein
MPAPVVFYLSAVLGAATIPPVLVVGQAAVWLPGLSCMIIVWALFVNDRTGFYHARPTRREEEPRRYFTQIEVGTLLSLLMLNVVLLR